MERLGQHFLKNRGKIKKIVAALELKDGDAIIEIGPGHGEVTKEIKNKKSKIKIIAIEKDEKLAGILKKKLETDRNSIEIIEGDVLKILPAVIRNWKLEIGNSGYKIAGNIPYYITGYLFRLLGELVTSYRSPVTNIVFTIQKEVAERVCAQPPKMNLLAASVQYWAEPKIIDFITKNDFYPRPEVDSAIIKLTPKAVTGYPLLVTSYYNLIKILFRQPRKTILNNLKSGLKLKKEEIIKKLLASNVNSEARPQDLTVEKLKKMAQILYNKET